MFRLLHFTSADGRNETVIITTEMDAPAEDFCPFNFEVDQDLRCQVVSGNIDTLPLEDELKASK